MVHIVPGAFVSAGLANVSAFRAEMTGVLAATGHCSGSELTDGRAVHVKRDAAGHHLDIFFLQT
jgi:hypothetical protein